MSLPSPPASRDLDLQLTRMITRIESVVCEDRFNAVELEKGIRDKLEQQL